MKTEIKTRTRSTRPKAKSSTLRPKNPARRAFLKVMGFGGAALMVGLSAKKLGSLAEGVATKKVSSQQKRTPLGKNVSFVENKKETIFYDGKGNEVLIFEKTA